MRKSHLCAAFVLLTSSLVFPRYASADRITEAPTVQQAINALKEADRARTGETGMFQPGNYTMYGLGYLENKKYLEATWGLKDAIKADPNYALAHFLLGQAYIGLELFDDARQSLEQAARLNPGYQAEVDAQLTLLQQAKEAAEKREAAKREAAKKPPVKAPAKPAPAPKTDTPRKGGNPKAPAKTPRVFKAPPMGNYVCNHIHWDVTERRIKFDYKGYFLLKSNGTYRWLDNGPTGRYRYNAKSREVKFLSGHLAQPGVVAKFGTDANGRTPEITITFHTAASRAKKAEPIEWQCVLEEK